MPEAHSSLDRDVAAATEDSASPHHEAGAGPAVSAMSDAELVSAMTFNDVDAFAETYDRHGDGVYGVVRRLCGQHQAEEVTREVFLALWRSAEDFSRSESSLRAALLGEAHRRGVALLRAEAAAHDGETTAPDSATRGTLPTGKTVGRLLSGLHEAEYRVITLAYFGGYTYQEIAVLVEKPEEAVLADIRAGLRRLSDRES